MEIFNLREWILKYFKVKISDKYDYIYFQFDDMVPPSIFEFDTRHPWRYFYENCILKFYRIKSDHDLVVTMNQLIEKSSVIWEKLYYITGMNFFIFLFFECRIYFKWERNTFILLTSEVNKPQKSLSCVYNNSSLLPTYTIGFDKNVDLHFNKILYSTIFQKYSKSLIAEKNPILLKNKILNQYVGPENFEKNAFGSSQTKSLKNILQKNPTIKKCRLILNNFVDTKDIVVPVDKIILFLSEVFKVFIPYKILLQKKMFRQFLKNMEKVLKFNLKQKLTLGLLMIGIAENLDPLRRNTIAKTVVWLTEEFIIKLIRSIFYVSVADKGYSLIFLKKEYWINQQKRIVAGMLLEKRLIEVKELVFTKEYKKVKFFPKLNGSGFRLVIAKSEFYENRDLTTLSNVFLKQLISSKRKGYPNPTRELHSAWLSYTKNRTNGLHYFFAKTDIQDAYGSIIHEKLKHILLDWCSGLENDLTALSFDFKGKWGKTETVQQFTNLHPSVGEKVIIYKFGKDEVVSLSKLLSHIIAYIDNIYVVFFKKKYRLVKGLPQGGKLSAALCELYYLAFDMDHLSNMFDASKGEILLRAVDDYIIICQSKEKIHRFLIKMSSGIPEYGVQIQLLKTDTNVFQLNGAKNPCDSTISFFGFNLDINSGFITSDLSRYKDIEFWSTMKFNKLYKRLLLHKISAVISLKIHSILLDPSYESARIIVFNIHSASCILALRFLATLKFLTLIKEELEEKYLLFCIEKGVHLIASLVDKKGKNWRRSIDYNAAKKVSLKSFILILNKKKYFYKIVEVLKKKASNLKVNTKRMEHIIRTVVKKLPPCLSTKKL